jgi:hypothetical protein
LEILPSFNKSLKIACLNAGIKSSAFGDNPTIKSLFSLNLQMSLRKRLWGFSGMMISEGL